MATFTKTAKSLVKLRADMIDYEEIANYGFNQMLSKQKQEGKRCYVQHINHLSMKIITHKAESKDDNKEGQGTQIQLQRNFNEMQFRELIEINSKLQDSKMKVKQIMP